MAFALRHRTEALVVQLPSKQTPLTLFERLAIGGLIALSMVIFYVYCSCALGLSVEWALEYFDLLPQNTTC